MGIDTTVVRGAEAVAQKLRKARESTAKFLNSDVLLLAILKSNLKRFDAQIGPDGVPWPGRLRTDSGKADRRSRGKKLLVREGTLRKAITTIRGSNTGTLSTATGAGGRIGVPANSPASKYGRFHQFGIGVVQRRFLGVSREDRVMVDSLLRNAILKLVK